MNVPYTMATGFIPEECHKWDSLSERETDRQTDQALPLGASMETDLVGAGEGCWDQGKRPEVRLYGVSKPPSSEAEPWLEEGVF